jgi:hypothetical protein
MNLNEIKKFRPTELNMMKESFAERFAGKVSMIGNQGH